MITPPNGGTDYVKITPKILKESHVKFSGGGALKASDGKKHFEVTAKWQAQNIKYLGGSSPRYALVFKVAG